MDTREYFEKVMQDYNQNRKGRSLRKYCKDEAVDYNWLMEYKKTYRPIKTQTNVGKKLSEGEFIALTVEENLASEQPTPIGWQVERLKILHYDINALCCTKSGLMMVNSSNLVSWRQRKVTR